MLSLIYQYAINLVVSLPVWRDPGVFTNVSVWDIVNLTIGFVEVAKFTILTSLSLLA